MFEKTETLLFSCFEVAVQKLGGPFCVSLFVRWGAFD